MPGFHVLLHAGIIFAWPSRVSVRAAPWASGLKRMDLAGVRDEEGFLIACSVDSEMYQLKSTAFHRKVQQT